MNLIPDDIDWRKYREETEAGSHVRPAAAFLDGMIEAIGKPKAKKPCAYLPWPKTHKVFAFREGEVTLWAGVNGHGKSLVTGQVTTSLLLQSQKCAVASFEMQPEDTLHRMIRQFAGLDGEDPVPELVAATKDIYEQFRGVADSYLWFYDQQGTVNVDRVISVTRYCFRELKIKHMIIDSLMKCVRHEDDYNAQKVLVDELTALARDYRAHVHLVHHLRKGDKETDAPDKSDVKGSGSIVDQVDNLMLVWRNKKKERDLELGKVVLDDVPDTLLLCRKQRNGSGWEGSVKLYFDKDSRQYTAAPGNFLDMAPWPHVETRKN